MPRAIMPWSRGSCIFCKLNQISVAGLREIASMLPQRLLRHFPCPSISPTSPICLQHATQLRNSIVAASYAFNTLHTTTRSDCNLPRNRIRSPLAAKAASDSGYAFCCPACSFTSLGRRDQLGNDADALCLWRRTGNQEMAAMSSCHVLRISNGQHFRPPSLVPAVQ